MPPPLPPPQVTCVVLNYNGWADTVACVQSLLVQDYPALRIVVVDNASTDDSVAHIRAAFPTVELIASPENAGFSAGNNLGLHHALAPGERSADFVWLLNNDTVAPPDTCSRLVAAAAANPNIGIVGTVLRYHHDPARVQAWGGGRLNPLTGFGRHFAVPTQLGRDSFLTFASVLLRRDMLAQTGFLDPNYFMYFEDADLCFRAREAGWQLAVAEGTAVLHKEGGSAGATASAPAVRAAAAATKARVVTASGMRFLRGHGHIRPLAPWVYLLTRLARRAVTLDLRSMRAVLQGARDYRRNQPRAFQGKSAR